MSNNEKEFSFVLYNPYNRLGEANFFIPKKDNAKKYADDYEKNDYFYEDTINYVTLLSLFDGGFVPLPEDEDDYVYNIVALNYRKADDSFDFVPDIVLIDSALGGGASKKISATHSQLPPRRLTEKYIPSLPENEFLLKMHSLVKAIAEDKIKKDAEAKKAEAEGLKRKPEGGIVVRSLFKKDKVKISYIKKSFHNLVIGTTGSGKTQSLVYPSILSIGNSNASMVINDPKGELYGRTCRYLKELGYNVYVLDYLRPEAGMRFNQLFLVNEEYKRGFPHLWAMQASKELIKIFKIIQNGGAQEGNYKLKYFREEIRKTLAGGLEKYEKDPTRCVSSGSRGSKEYDVYYIKPCGNLDTSVLKTLSDLDAQSAIDLAREILANAYEQIQKNALKEKGGSFKDIVIGNEHLRVRQEKVIQAAFDILNILTPENIQKYYEAKTERSQKMLKDTEGASKTREEMDNLNENISEYTEKIIPLKEGEFNIDIIVDFLQDSAKDHLEVWKEAESNASTMAGNVALMIVGTDSVGGDKYWTNTAKALVQALILLVCREAENDNQRHLGSVQRILSALSEFGSDDKSIIDKIIGRMDESDVVRNAAYSERIAADKTKTSIFSSTGEKMDIFSKPPVIDQCSKLDFDPEDLVNKKTAVFLIAPGLDDAGSAQYAILSTLFIEQAYSRLNQLLNRTTDQTCKRPIYFLVDECANIPSIPNLDAKVTLARSKNIRWTLCFQSFEQIKSKYKDGYATIKENTNCYYLLTNSMDTAKEISDRMGDETIEINSYSTSSNDKGTNTNTSTSTTGRKLMTPQEVMQLKESEALYLMQRQQPYKTHLEMAYKWPIYSWLEKNKIVNIHKSRDISDVGFFVPRWEDFNAAYDLENENCLIDDMIFNVFSSMKL